jgi:hypothetical protein
MQGAQKLPIGEDSDMGSTEAKESRFEIDTQGGGPRQER